MICFKFRALSSELEWFYEMKPTTPGGGFAIPQITYSMRTNDTFIA